MFRAITDYLATLGHGLWSGWNRFWFSPNDPATLSLVRILTGLMLLYTHLVWSLELEAFFGPNAWLNASAVSAVYSTPEDLPDVWPKPSFWWYVDQSPASLWAAHLTCLAIFASLTLGLFTRIVSVLAFVAVVSYAHRAPFALFGLDQINAFLTLYLCLGPAGARYSLDAWWASRRGKLASSVVATSGTTVAIRLMQVHLCLVYFVAGISKLLGDAWWEGHAMWMAFGNGQYQTLDMTWLAYSPWLLAMISHGTVIWEIFYCVLIWPRLTRPLMLVLAVLLHVGIGLCLGMVTFGMVMIIANMAFLPPEFVRRVFGPTEHEHPTATAHFTTGKRSRRVTAST